MATVEQRVGQMEGAYEHLATKADLAELKADLTMRMVMIHLVGYAAVAAIVSAVVAVLKLT